MTKDLIPPPPELVQKWWEEADQYQRSGDNAKTYFDHVAARAAQWGADQELEACCNWLQDPDLNVDTYKLRAARRPKQPSLKQQAMAVLDDVDAQLDAAHYNVLLRALEALPDDAQPTS